MRVITVLSQSVRVRIKWSNSSTAPSSLPSTSYCRFSCLPSSQAHPCCCLRRPDGWLRVAQGISAAAHPPAPSLLHVPVAHLPSLCSCCHHFGFRPLHLSFLPLGCQLGLLPAISVLSSLAASWHNPQSPSVSSKAKSTLRGVHSLAASGPRPPSWPRFSTCCPVAGLPPRPVIPHLCLFLWVPLPGTPPGVLPHLQNACFFTIILVNTFIEPHSRHGSKHALHVFTYFIFSTTLGSRCHFQNEETESERGEWIAWAHRTSNCEKLGVIPCGQPWNLGLTAVPPWRSSWQCPPWKPLCPPSLSWLS